jgi:hypothetical protein
VRNLDANQWTVVTDAQSVRGTTVFQPTHDKILAWSNIGLRLHRGHGKDDFYLARRIRHIAQQWLVKPYPIAAELARVLQKRADADNRLWHHPASVWGPEIVIIDCQTDVWGALSETPDPDTLASLYLQYPPPIKLSWPNRT